ncbi:MAG: hypothetical protein ABH821_02280 [archaeon]
MKKNNALFFSIVIVVVIALILVIMVPLVLENLNKGSYRFEVIDQGLKFQSNTAPPGELLQELKARPAVIVSPELYLQSPENTEMSKALNLFTVLFTATGKRTNVVARVIDERGELLYCQTNEADLNTSTELSVNECLQALIPQANESVVLINMPQDKESESRVVLTSNSIEIYSGGKAENLEGISFFVLEKVYPDIKAILEQVNKVPGSLANK